MSTDQGARAGTVPYSQSIDGCLEGAIGKHGLSPAGARADGSSPLAPAIAALQEDYRTRRLPHLRIAEDTADVAAAEAALARLSQGADTIVFFGIGGSSLGGQTLAQLGGWNIPGMANEAQRRRPRTRFYDNLDPVTLQSALGSFDLADTRFVITSKSGGTPETLVQALAALAAVKEAGLESRMPELFLGITEAAVPGKANGLRTLLEAHGIPILDHHPGIGGRYSAFTNVGLLPAMARGLDARAVRAGARDVVAALMAAKSPRDFAPALGAAVAVGLARERGIRALVMMPYADRLGRLGHWFAQLWAESLGKNGQGTAPISCLGPVDHHSQLQLFMDGPREYLVSIVRAPSAGLGPRMSPRARHHRRPRLPRRPDGGRPRRGAGGGRARGAAARGPAGAHLRSRPPRRALRGGADDAFRAGDDSRRAPHGRRPLRPARRRAGQGHHPRTRRGAAIAIAAVNYAGNSQSAA